MQIEPFRLERYFARYEFNVKHLMSASDCEALSMAELLDLASPSTRRRWDALRLSYTESQGDPELRAAIASTYQTITSAEILVAAPEEAIFLLMHALLSPDDEIIVLQPAYQSLHEIAASIGCTVKPWRVVERDGQWRLDLAALESLFTTRTRLLVINFPHNPTGCLPSHEEFAAIIALADRWQTPIFCDEMYRGLEYAAGERLPSICDVYARGIALSGLSKVHALPGLRIGWLAMHIPALLERIQALKDYTTICSSAPSEILAIAALEAEGAIIDRNLKIIDLNRQAAALFFARHADRFTWLPPRAGSVALPRWRGEQPVDVFCEQLVLEEGVLLVPGTMFEEDSDYFRIGLGRTGFLEGLEQFDAWLARR